MQTIEQAYEEVCRLHEQLTNTPAPEVGPHMFLPFPPGIDPIAFAVEEVVQLKQLFESAQRAQSEPAVSWVPRACIHTSETAVQFQIEIPGVAREDVSVSLTGGEMVVRGIRRGASGEGVLQPVLVEYAHGAFERRFPVPPWCNPEKIHAKCTNGVLEIRLDRQDNPRSGDFRVEIS